MSPDFKNGYGQARADILLRITEAIASIETSKNSSMTEEAKKEFVIRVSELKRVRALIKSLKLF